MGIPVKYKEILPDLNDSEIVNNVIKFISLIDDSIPIADVIEEPDGEVAFEWYSENDNKNVLSISVGKTENLSFAGMFEGGRIMGTEPISSFDVDLIKLILKKLK